MKWAIFCTIDLGDRTSGADYFLIDIADNEVEAVEAFRAHIREYDQAHIPHIYFAPAPASFLQEFGETSSPHYETAELEQFGFDLSINYFREPIDIKAQVPVSS